MFFSYNKGFFLFRAITIFPLLKHAITIRLMGSRPLQFSRSLKHATGYD